MKVRLIDISKKVEDNFVQNWLAWNFISSKFIKIIVNIMSQKT